MNPRARIRRRRTQVRTLAAPGQQAASLAAEVEALVCIFCRAAGDDADFAREHIVPDSIGGNLCLDGRVCTSCNSKLGHDVDVAILKNPEVLRAIQAVGWSKKYLTTLKNQWDVSADSPQGRLRLRTLRDHLEVAPQGLADGSHVRGDSFLPDWFEGQARAAVRRSGGTARARAEVDKEVARLQAALASVSLDEPVPSPLFGATLVRRSHPLQPHFEPRNPCDIKRAIAKIAYEFAFFVVGTRVAEYPTDNFEPFTCFILDGTRSKSVFVQRIRSQTTALQPVHHISLELSRTFTRFVVGLFRSITYLVIGPALPPSSLDYLACVLGARHAIGIQVQLDVEKRKRRFGVLLEGGETRLLDAY